MQTATATAIPIVAAVLLALAPPAGAQQQPLPPPQPPAEREYALTVYSTADPATFDPKQLAQQRQMNPYQFRFPGYGVVRDLRAVNLDAGLNTLRFTDVASGIDPTTVAFESLTDPAATAVVEQSYEYDVVSGNKLIDKYVGERVEVWQRLGDRVQPVAGTLLSADPSAVVLQSADGQVTVIARQDVTSVSVGGAKGLITKPTLVWQVQAAQAGEHRARVTYQTDGLTWRADYNVVVNRDDTAADLGAWVTVVNQSGASYPDAKLKLVAGDVQRITPPEQMHEMGYAMSRMAAADRAGPPGFQQKAFFEYHLYTLGRPTTLPNNATKQIELFDARRDVPVKKQYVYYGLPEQWRYWVAPSPNTDRNLGSQTNKKVDVYLSMRNDEKNGMGIPLPAGRVRVYKQDDADGTNEFVGEDVVQHTPKDENVLVKLGSAFDVVGERKQTDFTVNADGHVITESFEIKLCNHKPQPVDVIVKENLFRWVNWEITASSDKWEKQDYRTIHVPVNVPANGEKVVTYTVRYTW
ncbi:MAG TPA: DUF4139 domain-containing protein [Tepidisphaeraceae bacterium]|nr:DUF4139 domain-containing protein [Tepidisphaeraceae bacterium]